MNTHAQESTSATARVLVLDARDDIASLLPSAIHHRPLHAEHALGAEEACRRLVQGAFDVVLADIDVPSPAAVDLLRCIRQVSPAAKVVLISTGHSLNVMAELLRQKAFSLLVRPVTTGRLTEVIEHALAAKEWQDDIVLVSGTPKWIQVQIRCKIQAAERAVQIFRELPGELNPHEHEELATAFREMLMNAIEHGGRSDPSQSIYVSHVWTHHSLLFYLRDPGAGFPMNNLPHAAISNPDGSIKHAEVREQQGLRPGGFGILLARNMVDELIYSERGNEVVLVKHRRAAK